MKNCKDYTYESEVKHNDKNLAYNPSTSTAMVLFFAIICGISVANVYYAQPLLDILALEFDINIASVGIVITLTQVGSVLALLFIVPLGDILKRRHLLITQSLLLCISLLLVATSTISLFLYFGMLLVGMLGTAMTQSMIVYASVFANKNERGRVVGIAQGGVVIGLLLARTLSGIIADLISWRAVYFISAIVTLLLLSAIWKILPEQSPSKKIAYSKLLWSMLLLLKNDRALQIRGTLALLMFAVFGIFWSALALPLSNPPYSYSLTLIGSFGLVGAIGALGAVKAGSLSDRGLGQWVTGISLCILLLSWLPLYFMPVTVWMLIIGIILLDLGGQAIHVVNQSMIFSGQTENHSRLVGCYMMFYATGSAIGAFATTNVYALAGWSGVCILGAIISLLALLFWWYSFKSQ